MSRIILLLCLCFTLGGCTRLYYPYFRNFSGQPVELWYISDNDHFQKRVRTIKYSKKILPIKRSSYKKLNDSLQLTIRDRKTSFVVIPPGSTVLVPHYYISDEDIIFVKQANRVDTLLPWSKIRENGIRHSPGSFFVSIAYYDHK